MADTPLSERLIAGFKREAKDFLAYLLAGAIASVTAHNVPFTFWGQIAVFGGVFIITLIAVALLKRAWAHYQQLP